MSWNLKSQLKKTVAGEQGALIFAAGSRQSMALAYPNQYQVGMSNLGMHIIYNQVNSRGDFACERFFLPDKKTLAEYRRTNTPLLSLENQQPLYQFSLIAFAVSFEMDYFNIINMLSLGKVPELCADRSEEHPLVIIGGPCATFNPEPLADFVDACVIGEGEEVIHEILDTYAQSRQLKLPREQTLLNLSQLKGIYIPKYYQPVYKPDGTIKNYNILFNAPAPVKKLYIENLEKYPAKTVIKTSDAEFNDMFLIEISRGCGRHCRFCMAGHCFLKPRTRSAENIKEALKEAKEVYNYNKVGLVGAAVSDHPEIDEICQIIKNEQLNMSVASLRADSLSLPLTAALAQSSHKTITFAPEAGSLRLRQVLNKNISDDHLKKAVSMAVSAGINNVKLYIMIGLPSETEEDIEAIISLAKNLKIHMEQCGGKGTLTLSINPFIPKPFTPFQWLPMANEKSIAITVKKIRNSLKAVKGIELLFESNKEAYIQAVLARGDRRLGRVLKETKGEINGWKKAVKQIKENNKENSEGNLEEDFYLYRLRGQDEILPWHNLSMGFEEGYLTDEYKRALEGKNSPPCRAGCQRCGICI